MIREICTFAVTMVCVGLYVAWRERRIEKSLRSVIEENSARKEDSGFGAVMQLAVGSETRMLPSAGTQRSLADQRLLSQVSQLLALRG